MWRVHLNSSRVNDTRGSATAHPPRSAGSGGCPSDPAGVASLLTPCFRFLEAAEAELEGGRGGSNPPRRSLASSASAGSLGGGSSAAFGTATRVAAAATARQAVDVVFERRDAARMPPGRGRSSRTSSLGGRVARELARGEPLELDRGVGDGRARSSEASAVYDLFMRSDALEAEEVAVVALADAPEKTARGVERSTQTLHRTRARAWSARCFEGGSAGPPWRRSRTSPPSSGPPSSRRLHRGGRGPGADAAVALDPLTVDLDDRYSSALDDEHDLDAERGTTTLADLVTIVARIVQEAAALDEPANGRRRYHGRGGRRVLGDGRRLERFGDGCARGGRLGGGGGAGEGGAHDAPKPNAEARDAGGFSGGARRAASHSRWRRRSPQSLRERPARGRMRSPPSRRRRRRRREDVDPSRGSRRVAAGAPTPARSSRRGASSAALVVALEEARGEVSWARSRRAPGISRRPPARAARAAQGTPSSAPRAGRSQRTTRRRAPRARRRRRVDALRGLDRAPAAPAAASSTRLASLGRGHRRRALQRTVGSATTMLAAAPSAAPVAQPPGEELRRSGAPRSTTSLAAAAKNRAARSFPPPPRRRATASPRSCSRRRTSRRSGRSSTSAHRLAETLVARRSAWSSRAPRAGARAGSPRRRRRSRRRWGPGRRRSAASAARPRGREGRRAPSLAAAAEQLFASSVQAGRTRA